MAITTRADGLILVTAGDAVSLASPVGKDGNTWRVKNTGTVQCVVTPVAGLIGGKASWMVKPGQCWEFTSDGANYIATDSAPIHAHATFKSPAGASGRFHCFGYYFAPAASKAATQAAATQTHGTANVAYGAKAFLVAAGAGTASGGTTGVGKITVSGTSVSDTGVRVQGDTEIIVPDTSVLTANQYVESTKYWVGQVTFTLGQTGDRTAYALTFNYGFAKYFEFSERNVVIHRFEATGRAGAADTGFNIELLRHDGTGWTYSASAFIPGGTVIASMATDYGPEKNLANGERFAWERYNVDAAVDGTLGNTGIVVRITTGANNAVESMDCRIDAFVR